MTPNPANLSQIAARGYARHPIAHGVAGMSQNDPDQTEKELLERLQAMSRGKKIVLVVFIIWAIQAVPKWTFAIFADGETSAKIMKVFVTPR
jgi:hypothetical protein